VLVRLDDAVVTAVKDLQQTVVSEIKAGASSAPQAIGVVAAAAAVVASSGLVAVGAGLLAGVALAVARRAQRAR
jgi:predicted branched-subunit amino acid permease